MIIEESSKTPEASLTNQEVMEYYVAHKPKDKYAAAVNFLRYDASLPKITLEDFERICSETDDFITILKAIEEIQPYPDNIVEQTAINRSPFPEIHGGYLCRYKVENDSIYVTVAFGQVYYYPKDLGETVVLYDRASELLSE